jgi:hypothetical protein
MIGLDKVLSINQLAIWCLKQPASKGRLFHLKKPRLSGSA